MLVDVAHAVVEIGGPDVLSYGDMMRRYAALRGQTRLMVPVPVLSPRISSYWVGLVTDVPPGIAQPLIEGLRNEVVVRHPEAARAHRSRAGCEPLGTRPVSLREPLPGEARSKWPKGT